MSHARVLAALALTSVATVIVPSAAAAEPAAHDALPADLTALLDALRPRGGMIAADRVRATGIPPGC